ncbi:M16 family metallopeptidase [Algoriphagus zhangzhouensis]|uniref:Predicted Zn-dependent peptidase n=1 Tax=Algoriphagus zhangzhouensis TaxID=1073327 RepID=A0A1M7ZEX9_9BACT|nr:pitrilysin family protein [Algoriphagus zhangzhouensis]TDY46139.1 putative Zn-dependent peptidase [Algoriphagus zhangzhouensis]SHO63428.1 Predicted Zn-dependent peptidase [Algoriphagus zhangzhouensis]
MYQIKELANGIRIVHQEVTHTRLVHCGFILNIGSRDETKEQEGLAHFWEHMAFKGTQKRKTFHIINRLESLGGELNAYTTKEKICFYASVLKEHYSKAADLLFDITFNSTFPTKEIEKERQVILEEMSMYRDSPDDSIQDELDTLVFENHALGRNILGTEETVSNFSQQDFFDFISSRLDTSQVVFSIAGNISFAKALKAIEGPLSQIQSKKTLYIRSGFHDYSPQNKIVKRDITQSLCAIGRPAFSQHDKNRYKLFLLNNILGGPSMNSRLNLALREKYGYVYSIESSYQPFSDTGFFGIFFGTEEKTLKKSMHLVHRELVKLRTKKLGTMQLHMAKEQAIGQMAMAEENYAALMLVFGKSLIDHGKIDPLERIFEQIRSTTAEEVLEIAEQIFDPEQLSYLTYLPN